MVALSYGSVSAVAPPGAAAASKPRGRKLGLPRVDSFLGWLAEDQAERGESDTDYAARRGLSRGLYANAKAGRRGLSRAIVERICKHHHDAKAAYIALCLTSYGVSPLAAPPDLARPGGDRHGPVP